MIYCINQPLEKYNTIVNGVEVGLYNSYKERPAIMALVFLMTHAPFEYESTSTVPAPLRSGKLDDYYEDLLSDTLVDVVGNKMIIWLLENLSPADFYEYLQGFDLSHLAIRKFYTSDENLRLIVRARVGAWLDGQGAVTQTTITEHRLRFKEAKTKVINHVNGGK